MRGIMERDELKVTVEYKGEKYGAYYDLYETAVSTVVQAVEATLERLTQGMPLQKED